ncbi:MAG: DUF4956 domain-containing protein [Gemmatimonadetes bacterium]|nr:DUF4956 domain-containing protein [Gemmatimonadota bacterium]
MLRRFFEFLTQAPRAPIRQLVAYYAVVAAATTALAAYIPIVRSAIVGGARGAAPDSGLSQFLNPSAGPETGRTLAFDLTMVIVMIGAFLVALPVTWTYMATRFKRGFDQSLVQTLLVLPVLVASIIMIVQNSLVLAFALAAVVAAVRFRSTLKDAADAMYIFLAIGIGSAAGVQALTAAFIMSLLFSVLSVTLWSCDFGRCLVPPEPAAGGGKESRRGTLAVRVGDAEARAVVEDVLARRTRKFKFGGARPDGNSASLLNYRVQFKKSVQASDVIAALLKRRDAAILDASLDARQSASPA